MSAQKAIQGCQGPGDEVGQGLVVRRQIEIGVRPDVEHGEDVIEHFAVMQTWQSRPPNSRIGRISGANLMASGRVPNTAAMRFMGSRFPAAPAASWSFLAAAGNVPETL